LQQACCINVDLTPPQVGDQVLIQECRLGCARAAVDFAIIYMTLLLFYCIFIFSHAIARPLSKNKNFFVKEVVKRVEKS
jgi:hypothetical protein